MVYLYGTHAGIGTLFIKMAEDAVKTEVRHLITTTLQFVEKAKHGETNVEHAKLECTSRLRRTM